MSKLPPGAVLVFAALIGMGIAVFLTHNLQSLIFQGFLLIFGAILMTNSRLK